MMTLALASDHRDDLRKSGLSDECIATLQIEAVRPEDIKNLSGVLSAYRLPYFDLNGARNCFERLKVFPPITTPDGHTQKYWQPANSDPQLYLPPVLNWKRVATTSTCTLILTEGEKKSAAACQVGLIAAGLGGVWNWRTKLDNGERLVLPTLDQFVWTGRLVELVPDSDAWQLEKLLEVCAGFYALAQELVSRGARVCLVRLPDLRGVKTGLDDWLVSVGAEWEHLWLKLERVALDAPSLKKVAAWWQRWRAKHTDQEALQNRLAQELEIQEIGGLFTVTCPIHHVRFLFDRLTESHNGIRAELAVHCGCGPSAVEMLSGTDISLKSDTSRTKIAATLRHLRTEIPWLVLLQKACAHVVRLHREGEPPVLLTIQTPVEHLTYQVNPFVHRGKVGILFGDGGLGKSTLGLLCAMLCATGESVAGLSAVQGRALYLDYEDSVEVHALRLKAIAAGHPVLRGAEVLYQFCAEPLPVMGPQLLRRITHEHIDLLIVDSLALACGGDPQSAESTARVFRVLRQLKCAALILAHQPKNLGEQEPSIFGSVFNRNLARSVWEVRKDHDSDQGSLHLGLYHRKANHSRIHPALGFKVTCDEDWDRVFYESDDVSAHADLAQGLPVRKRLEKALTGGAKTAKELAEDIGAPLKQVRNRLDDGLNKWVMHVGERGRECLWGLHG